MGYKMKKMLNIQPKIYAEENYTITKEIDKEENVRLHSSSSSLLPVDESYLGDKKSNKQYIIKK